MCSGLFTTRKANSPFWSRAGVTYCPNSQEMRNWPSKRVFIASLLYEYLPGSTGPEGAAEILRRSTFAFLIFAQTPSRGFTVAASVLPTGVSVLCKVSDLRITIER